MGALTLWLPLSLVSWECQWHLCWQVKLLSCLDIGAGFGTYKAGAGIAAIGIWKPEVIMKSLIPVVMAGILGIYGMIVAVLLSQKGTDCSEG